MESVIKGIILNNGFQLISEIEELFVGPDEPDCRLINPYLYKDGECEKWPSCSSGTEVVIKSSNILTIVEVEKTVLKKYIELTAE
jgi:hypothetical protein